jgi:glycosyltransferase involved in cell wall biosynthesis
MLDKARVMTGQQENNLITTIHQPEQIRKICFYSYNYQDALSHLRMIGPAHHLGLEVIAGIENNQIFVDRALLGDVIVLQRDFPRAIQAYEAILNLARQNDLPVILDIDDLLFELPQDHPDRRKHIFTWTFLPMFRAMLEVDLITVTTQPLREYLLAYNKNVQVLPNYLDDDIWKLIPPVRKGNLVDRVIIGYMGGLSHQSDLAPLIPIISNLIHRFPERLEFHFWGTQPVQELSSHPCVHWNNQIIWNYKDFAAFFNTQTADIFLSPLVDNLFNSCKSAIKYLEYTSIGVAGIYSRMEPYASVIRHSENGLLASTPEDWENCLLQLIENPEQRYNLALNAQADIRSNWLLSQNAPRWLSAFRQASENKFSRVTGDSSYLQMLSNIANQTVEWHKDTEHQLFELSTSLSRITNSTTWKLALKLRQIRENLFPSGSRREKLLDRIMEIAARNSTKGK